MLLLSIYTLSVDQTKPGNPSMKTIQVYDRAMCCSTGVCGPQVDPALARFASDLEWIRTQGGGYERFNLGQQPQAFVENTSVTIRINSKGVDCLPLIVVDGDIVSQGVYPSRESLAHWAGLNKRSDPLLVISGEEGCCSTPGCC